MTSTNKGVSPKTNEGRGERAWEQGWFCSEDIQVFKYAN